MHATTYTLLLLYHALQCDAMQFILGVILVGLNWYLLSWNEYACSKRSLKMWLIYIFYVSFPTLTTKNLTDFRNRLRLTTHFDLYGTFRDLAELNWNWGTLQARALNYVSFTETRFCYRLYKYDLLLNLNCNWLIFSMDVSLNWFIYSYSFDFFNRFWE